MTRQSDLSRTSGGRGSRGGEECLSVGWRESEAVGQQTDRGEVWRAACPPRSRSLIPRWAQPSPLGQLLLRQGDLEVVVAAIPYRTTLVHRSWPQSDHRSGSIRASGERIRSVGHPHRPLRWGTRGERVGNASGFPVAASVG